MVKILKCITNFVRDVGQAVNEIKETLDSHEIGAMPVLLLGPQNRPKGTRV